MALIECSECGKEISDTAISCPHCGFVFKKQKPKISFSNTKVRFIAIALAIILVLSIAAVVIISSQKNFLKGQTLEEVYTEDEITMYTRGMLALNELYNVLKNPDSIKMRDMLYYIEDYKYCCAIEYSATNTFGGTMKEYVYYSDGELSNDENGAVFDALNMKNAEHITLHELESFARLWKPELWE